MKKPYFLFTALICWLLFPCMAQGQGILFLPSSKTKLFSDIRGEEVKLKAFGLHGHQFLHWGNGSPSNIQSFMACDTLVEAYFDEYSSIVEADTVGLLYELVPNPARGVVTVVTGEGVECSGRCRVELRDVTGRVVKSGVLEGRMTAMDIADLRAGVYFVTVVTPQGLSTRKLAVE